MFVPTTLQTFDSLPLPTLPAGSNLDDLARAGGGALALRQVVNAGLSVPLRSSIVRNLLLIGEGTADILLGGPVIYAEVVGLVAEAKAKFKTGTCQ